MFDIEDIMYDDYIPILDDDCDEYLDAECDELSCECESTIGAMLDAEIEAMQEQGILNESFEYIDAGGNIVCKCDDEDDDDDEDDSDDVHYYIDDGTEDDEDDDDDDYEDSDPSEDYAAVQDLEVNVREED